MRASWLTSWDRGRISQTSMMHCSMIQNDQVTKMLEIYQQDSSIIIICDFHYVSIIQFALRTYLIFLTNRRAASPIIPPSHISLKENYYKLCPWWGNILHSKPGKCKRFDVVVIVADFVCVYGRCSVRDGLLHIFGHLFYWVGA